MVVKGLLSLCPYFLEAGYLGFCYILVAVPCPDCQELTVFWCSNVLRAPFPVLQELLCTSRMETGLLRCSFVREWCVSVLVHFLSLPVWPLVSYCKLVFFFSFCPYSHLGPPQTQFWIMSRFLDFFRNTEARIFGTTPFCFVILS